MDQIESIIDRCDPIIPFDHILHGRIRAHAIEGAHSPERTEWASEMITTRRAAILTEGKTFFPHLDGGDAHITLWLGGLYGGAIHQVLDQPEALTTRGKWGWNSRILDKPCKEPMRKEDRHA